MFNITKKHILMVLVFVLLVAISFFSAWCYSELQEQKKHFIGKNCTFLTEIGGNKYYECKESKK